MKDVRTWSIKKFRLGLEKRRYGIHPRIPSFLSSVDDYPRRRAYDDESWAPVRGSLIRREKKDQAYGSPKDRLSDLGFSHVALRVFPSAIRKGLILEYLTRLGFPSLSFLLLDRLDSVFFRFPCSLISFRRKGMIISHSTLSANSKRRSRTWRKRDPLVIDVLHWTFLIREFSRRRVATNQQ